MVAVMSWWCRAAQLFARTVGPVLCLRLQQLAGCARELPPVLLLPGCLHAALLLLLLQLVLW